MSPRRSSVASFYDSYRKKLVTEYVLDHRRTRAAIAHAVAWLDPRMIAVLDIGFGIGWSTHELRRRLPDARLTGLDLSEALTEGASLLFGDEGIDYRTQDVTELAGQEVGQVDAVVLLDVYEHIPKEGRVSFHAALNQCMAPQARVILTFPSPAHQSYLRCENPSGLQPVDEDVTSDDLVTFAENVGGDLVYNDSVNIWRTGDYVHAVIERGDHVQWHRPTHGSVVRLEPLSSRRQRVKERLAVQIGPSGVWLPRKEGLSVCVVCPVLGAHSETFIANHIERLGGRVNVVYGFLGEQGLRRGDGGSALLGSWSRRSAKLAGRVIHRDLRNRLEQRALRKYLAEINCDVVLAEYGVVGLRVMDACVQSGVPLVAHFHGYDAYTCTVLEGPGRAYPDLFRAAARIVASSHHMRSQLVSLGAPEEKIRVVPCGADTGLFRPATPADNPPVFLATGRFVEKKAPYLTILAFAECLESYPHAQLRMIGDGALLDPCRELARALGVQAAVTFLGAVDHRRVACEMAKARTFVQHSIRPANGDSEGTPVAVMEAGAAALPVVATRHAGIGEVVEDGRTGFLVAERDIHGMAKAMVRLAKDADLAGSMGSQAREHILRQYTLDKMILELQGVLDEVAQARRR